MQTIRGERENCEEGDVRLKHQWAFSLKALKKAKSKKVSASPAWSRYSKLNKYLVRFCLTCSQPGFKMQHLLKYESFAKR